MYGCIDMQVEGSACFHNFCFIVVYSDIQGIIFFSYIIYHSLIPMELSAAAAVLSAYLILYNNSLFILVPSSKYSSAF